ncbi:hypothetical protein [Virgibacillus ihumii]|uniref:hypothetical protein n=1 Tax=Virgibacillus ihumii TaxID=2686091 RepID=UPI00157C9CA7|nr:hypothetical protein [Virgibacillus ihumii]
MNVISEDFFAEESRVLVSIDHSRENELSSEHSTRGESFEKAKGFGKYSALTYAFYCHVCKNWLSLGLF